MPNYLFTYHGGKMPETPEEGQAEMAKWMAWFQGIGEAVVDGGNPVLQSYTVSDSGVVDNGGANPVSGYSIISAASVEAACDIAKGCPMVENGSGTVEVTEIHEMEM